MLSHLFGQAVEVQCAGRTDAGVHARGQVAHLDVTAWPDDVDVRRINRALPDDVRVTAIERELVPGIRQSAGIVRCNDLRDLRLIESM